MQDKLLFCMWSDNHPRS